MVMHINGNGNREAARLSRLSHFRFLLQSGGCLTTYIGGGRRAYSAIGVVLIPIVNTVFSCLRISAPIFEISDERRELQMVQNIARIAKAALHNLPGKSILNVSFVFPVDPVRPIRPVHDNHDYHNHHDHGDQDGDREEVGSCT